MKQGTIKSFGIAALGAVIATGAAGTASAAGPFETAATTAQSVTRSLPIEDVAPMVPGGPVLSAANRVVGSSAFTQATKALDKATTSQGRHVRRVSSTRHGVQQTPAAETATEAAPADAPAAAPAKKAAPKDSKGNGGLLSALGKLPVGLPKNGLSMPIGTGGGH
ncbi:hypothetical protein [Streptomyces orinoci]|uniref:ATP-binding protein n=1 Tax=Streptomyces orinoci TaxID=67339 RepID=A0ABV3JUF4_STRON|nr:hypothetical protein [Streptomyces orinoci]